MTIGRHERGNFPELGLKRVILKVDTGAYSSAIHCTSIRSPGDGVLHVVFLSADDSGFTGQELTFSKFGRRRIKSSSGHSELRYSIETKLSLGGIDYQIRLTLTDRSQMRVPVLLGRRFLKRNRFIVDPARRHLLGTPKRKVKKK